jgi:DNA-binding NtrC family response regulator
MSTYAQVRIVVVDDTPTISSFYKDVLEDEGFSDVTDFVDPKEVLSLAEKGDLRPDIVISDFDMGKMNGVMLLNSLSKINPFLRSMIVTGSPERVLEISRIYPIINKNAQSTSQIIDLVKKFAEELKNLKTRGF